MKNEIIVSIGVPVYNNERHIAMTLKSLLSQSYKNIEIIISDDASTDKTAQICKEIADKHKNVTFYRQKRNLGTPENFNFVLKKARGTLFLWAAGDDIRPKDCVREYVYMYRKHPDLVLCVSDMKQFNETYSETVQLGFSETEFPFDITRKFLIQPEIVAPMVLGMYKTSVIRSLGGYHRDNRPIFQGASDLVTSYKMIISGQTGYISKPLLHKRDSGYYLNKYDILKQKSIPADFLKRVKRYMNFPIMFMFDLYYILRYTFSSRMSSSEKTIVYLYCIRKFMIDNIRFITTIIRGAVAFTTGRIAKFGIYCV